MLAVAVVLVVVGVKESTDKKEDVTNQRGRSYFEFSSWYHSILVLVLRPLLFTFVVGMVQLHRPAFLKFKSPC